MNLDPQGDGKMPSLGRRRVRQQPPKGLLPARAPASAGTIACCGKAPNPPKKQARKMKRNKQLQGWLPAVLVAAGMSAAVVPAFAQNTNNPNAFNTAADITSWTTWWGPPNPTITWDSTLDAHNDANSGSMRYEEAFVARPVSSS